MMTEPQVISGSVTIVLLTCTIGLTISLTVQPWLFGVAIAAAFLVLLLIGVPMKKVRSR